MTAAYGCSLCLRWRLSRHTKRILISCLVTPRSLLGQRLLCWYSLSLSWFRIPAFLGMSADSYLDMAVRFPSLPMKRQKSNLQVRGSRIPQIPRAAREDTALDRRKNESAWKTSTLRISRSKDIRPIWRPPFHQPDSCRNSRQWNSFGIRREHTEIRAMSDAFWNHV